MKSPIRILIVDDHFLLRIGLATSINAEPDMEIVAEAGTSAQAIEHYRQHQPDVVLMDVRLPDKHGAETVAILKEEYANPKVIMISNSDAHEDIYRAVRAGAWSYLPKGVMRDELLRTIRVTHAGERYLPEPVSRRLVERMSEPELTAREIEVVNLLVGGLSNKEIAHDLSIAEITVKNHISGIMAKLKATDRTHASTIAIQRGIVLLD